jgi:anaerobic magnesium-protoporphyrin IX monomethyl ester cyclase
MKTLLLNLPNRNRVTRRYMCSYLAANSLFPPLELIALGGIVRDWKQDEVELLDAIALSYNQQQTFAFIEQYKPDIIVSISGFECFEEDMEHWTALKQAFPEITFVLFGHYVSEYPQEVMLHTPTDVIMLGEPDLIFSQLYDALKYDGDLSSIKGIAYRKGQQVMVQASEGRIPNPNDLPMPAYDLLPTGAYHEPFMPTPFGMVQSARGCPYQCNYCVKSFGTKLTMLSPEHVIRDIRFLQERFGIKALRFIDDTFTAVPKRVLAICELIKKEGIQLEWTCLSRPDTLNEEMAKAMADAGCRRIYFGIESGSPRMLKLMNKEFDLQKAKENVAICQKYGIEAAAFFLSGHPEEALEDVKMSAEFAVQCGLDYVALNELTPYPGTALFRQLREQIDFSLFPYQSRFKRSAFAFAKGEKVFYRKFYWRPTYMLNRVVKLRRYYKEIAIATFNLLLYMWKSRKVVYPNYKAGFGKAEVTFKPVAPEKPKESRALAES